MKGPKSNEKGRTKYLGGGRGGGGPQTIWIGKSAVCGPSCIGRFFHVTLPPSLSARTRGTQAVDQVQEREKNYRQRRDMVDLNLTFSHY